LKKDRKEAVTGSDLPERVEKALGIAAALGQISGDHHKTWVIDQMVRALTGCISKRVGGQSQLRLGESEEYREFVRIARAGEDGPDTYEWDTGIAP
jgi:hypothetical protein